MTFNFIKNPELTFVKILAIAFVTVIYSFGGIILTAFSNKYIINVFYDKTDEELEKKSTIVHLSETTIILAFYGVLAYIAKNILQEIPFPLDGLYDLKYNNIKEVTSGALLLWILLNYSPILANKIKIIRNRFHLII